MRYPVFASAKYAVAFLSFKFFFGSIQLQSVADIRPPYISLVSFQNNFKRTFLIAFIITYSICLSTYKCYIHICHVNQHLTVASDFFIVL